AEDAVETLPQLEGALKRLPCPGGWRCSEGLALRLTDHAGMDRPAEEILPLPQMLQMHRRAAAARWGGENQAQHMRHQLEGRRPARRFGFAVCRLRFQLLPPNVRLMVTLAWQGGQGTRGRGLSPVAFLWPAAFICTVLLCLAGFAVTSAAWA